jgi:hypothetical protein
MFLKKGVRSRRLRAPSLIPAAAFLFLASAHAGTIYNNGPPDQADGANITGFVAADDFALAGSVTLTGGSFWSSANFDPFANSFSGTIGWGILANVSGSPGSILFSGSDSSPVLTDTGVQIFGTEEWRIDFSLGSINLNSGIYWLALHEGSLGTPDDGTTIFWDTTGSQTGSLSQFTADVTGASGWSFNSGLRSGSGSDLAFLLSGTSGGGTPTPSPEPSTLGLVSVAFMGTSILRNVARRGKGI